VEFPHPHGLKEEEPKYLKRDHIRVHAGGLPFDVFSGELVNCIIAIDNAHQVDGHRCVPSFSSRIDKISCLHIVDLVCPDQPNERHAAAHNEQLAHMRRQYDEDEAAFDELNTFERRTCWANYTEYNGRDVYTPYREACAIQGFADRRYKYGRHPSYIQELSPEDFEATKLHRYNPHAAEYDSDFSEAAYESEADTETDIDPEATTEEEDN
jgi:hypothetical protein